MLSLSLFLFSRSLRSLLCFLYLLYFFWPKRSQIIMHNHLVSFFFAVSYFYSNTHTYIYFNFLSRNLSSAIRLILSYFSFLFQNSQQNSLSSEIILFSFFARLIILFYSFFFFYKLIYSLSLSLFSLSFSLSCVQIDSLYI